MRKILESLRRPLRTDRRGIALIMVMMVVSSLLIIGILFSGSVTAEYRAAVYYRQAIQSEQYCIVGLHRAMAEMMYDVWGVYEDAPFLTARYNPYPAETDVLGNAGTFDVADPATNTLALTDCSPLNDDGTRGDTVVDAAYYCTGDGAMAPITQQRGFWNGQAWVVWAGAKVADTGDAVVDNIWNMRAEPYDRPELEGGAQRYLSYGSGTSTGTVTVGASATGPSTVNGNGTHFDVSWITGRQIYIDGALYTIDTVTDETTLTIQEAHAGVVDAKYYVPGSSGGDCPASACGTFLGGCQSITDFINLGKGYASNPKWVNPAKFIKYVNEDAFAFGGVDLNADGQVTADDKALRNWAVWQLKRDAFLPESIDNNDLFQNSLHANNRLLWSNGDPADKGYEFLDPKAVGDSFYLIFRFDPIYSLASNISEDPTWSPGDPLDGGPAGKANQTGYRYPYDRTHVGKWGTVPWADDFCGGLTNINACNNDYNMEQWCNAPTGPPQNCVWYHYPEAKWIYCYDPLDPEKKFGRYAASVMPDCGTWNASELHCGEGSIKSTRGFLSVGSVTSVAMFVSGMRQGWKPQTGDDAGGTLLQSHTYSCAPIRPNPLPTYWANAGTDGGSFYYPADGGPYDTFQDGHWPPVDYTRAQEIVGGHTSHGEIRGQPWVSRGVRSMIFNYLIWLGPYDSRAELATHIRKNLYCFEPPYDKYPDNTGKTPDLRRCMAERDMSQAAADKASSDAMMFSALTTVQGYYYTLDRFWDRDLLIVDWKGSPTSGDDDPRFASTQCPNNVSMVEADAALKPGQQTRRYYIQLMQDLECFGGYRTRDGDYKLNRYLFDNDYLTYNPDPAGRVPGPIYGGGGVVQTKCSRMEKMIAISVSRMACMARGAKAKTAACPRGHTVNNPRISTWHKPVFAAGTL
ncbi:MAG: hypothetical protein ACYTGB_16705, partial [Planctomycetota bacterium]